MQKLKKIIATALAILMLTGMISIFAQAEESETITVSIRVEGVTDTLYYNKSVTLPAGATALDLAEELNDIAGAPEVVVSDSTYGAYISAIGGIAEFDYGGYSGWLFQVNSTDASQGASLTVLEDGDSVIFYYGDPYGEPGMQYPTADISRLLSDGIIAFTSMDVTYTEMMAQEINKRPVAGATVIFKGNTYITDENGLITVESKAGLSGLQSLQIERYDAAESVPTVLRFAPDYEVYVPFADTPDSEWYADAVKYCVEEWAYQGTDLAANLFEPERYMNNEELVMVLAKLAGADLSASGEDWYEPALNWAVNNGIVASGEYVRGEPVARELFLEMFYRTISLIGKDDMTIRADITGAADYELVTAGYRDAVSWAVAAGIVKGNSDSELVLDPTGAFTRAMVCQLLYNYFN